MDWKNGNAFTRKGQVQEFGPEFKSRGNLPNNGTGKIGILTANTGKVRYLTARKVKTKEIWCRT